MITPKKFESHIRWLARRRYTSITLDMLLEARSNRALLPRRPVIITFDDGFRDCIDFAAPILQGHGFTAIFFLVSGLMERTSTWLLRDRGIELPLASWSDAQRLIDAGFQCGSHTVTHPRLSLLDPAACQYELAESRRMLEDRLGTAITHLAFPHGSYTEDVARAAASAGKHSACSVRIGLSQPSDDLLALHRVPIDGREPLFDFACKVRLGQTAAALVQRGARGVLARTGFRQANA